MLSLSLFLCNLSFSLAAFMVFSLSVDLNNLIMLCLGIDFFMFHLLEISKYMVYSFHHIWKSINHISSNSFSLTSTHVGTLMTHVWLLEFVPQFNNSLFILLSRISYLFACLFLFFFLCLQVY